MLGELIIIEVVQFRPGFSPISCEEKRASRELEKNSIGISAGSMGMPGMQRVMMAASDTCPGRGWWRHTENGRME